MDKYHGLGQLLAALQEKRQQQSPAQPCGHLFNGCNLRCPFCHNAQLVTHIDSNNTLSIDELTAFLKKRQGILDGVCVTGGEPLLDEQGEKLIATIKQYGYLVKLDTNGFFPDRLKKLLDKKLIDYVAVDIKNSKSRYGMTVGRPDIDLSPLETTIELLSKGNIPYEYRTTVVKPLHDRQSLVELAQWIKGCDKYYLQQFVDSGDLINNNGLSAYTEQEMHSLLKDVQQIIPQAQLRGIE